MVVAAARRRELAISERTGEEEEEEIAWAIGALAAAAAHPGGRVPSAVAVLAGAAHGRAARGDLAAWEEEDPGAVAGGDKHAMVKEKLMRSTLSDSAWKSLQVLTIIAVFAVFAGQTILLWGWQQTTKQASSHPASSQKMFGTPQQAAEALITAAGNYDVPSLLEIFGPDGRDLVASADAVRDKSIAKDFAAKAHERNSVTIDRQNQDRAILSVGDDNWPFPVPIVRSNGRWYFNAKEGREEILFRRIGANELDAIQICRGFVEAQKEYASEVHDNSGIHQYAQKIFSTPGKQDGLYWQNADGTPSGPISEAVAKAINEGYSPGKPGFHGYYFKVLKGQGPAAPLGQLDYVIEGVMIGGFGLVAVPAEYRVTGVKTFMVSYDGIVYEKDLGPKSVEIVKNMDRYNPDKTWQRTNDHWPANVSSSGN